MLGNVGNQNFDSVEPYIPRRNNDGSIFWVHGIGHWSMVFPMGRSVVLPLSIQVLVIQIRMINDHHL